MKATLFEWQGVEMLPVNHPPEILQPQLVICFAAKEILAVPASYITIRNKFPDAQIAMCSTAGEIIQSAVQDHSLIAVAISFESTTIKTATININQFENSYAAGVALINKLPLKGLVNILVFSDGSAVNGSELVKGLSDTAGKNILISGGLAADGAEFHSTLVGLNEQPDHGNIIAIGFYGDRLSVTHGSFGGWDMFGPEREVTKSEDNKLFEIDHINALELYTKYLGPEAAQLPGSALLFPLSIIIPGITQPVVRTILSIDMAEQSMIFAGDIPTGSKVHFMRSNLDRLTSAASQAAQQVLLSKKTKPCFSLLVSCVGRKLILGKRTEEEVQAVTEILGEQSVVAGFYSYGEISPFNEGGDCRLHNQTMTITSFYELS